MDILAAVNLPNVRFHADIHHMIEQGEDPAQSISDASDYIAYLHLHGTKRVAPGSRHDTCDWPEIVGACRFIDDRTDGPIPVIPEPFGKETCKENPALGEGLPPMGPLRPYLTKAYATLRHAGLHV